MKILLAINEILDFIREDMTSEKKLFAKTGLRYYEGDHDIKDYKLFYFNADGEVVEDKTRSNIKISHFNFQNILDIKNLSLNMKMKQFSFIIIC